MAGSSNTGSVCSVTVHNDVMVRVVIAVIAISRQADSSCEYLISLISVMLLTLL